ncbi:MAG: sensor histidine kinase [Acutalibacteraceae bacterium]
MQKKSAKPYILIGIVDVLLLFAVLFVWTALSFNGSHNNDGTQSVSIAGEYSADGESWIQMQSSDDFENKNYEKVVFRGRLSQNVPKNQWLIISMCDAWTELKVNGKTVASNLDGPGASTDTPGNSIAYISSDDIPDNAVLELTVTNPYAMFRSLSPIENTLKGLCIGHKDALYVDLLKNNTSAIIVSLAICFLGLFAFTLAGMLWKNVRYRNLALSFLAISGGLYVLTDSIYKFLPLWIDNPVMCMLFDEFASYLLPIAAFIYIRVNVENKRSKTYLSILTLVTIVLSVLAAFLQLFGVMDILKSQMFVFPIIILGIIGCIVCLIHEAFRLKSKSSGSVLLSLCPLIIASLIDALNSLTGFAPERVFMRLGLLLTVVMQLYLLFRETRQHQRELLRYQEMQNEMLQMRVSIMVSQIQPHFLYNSLTSIAQLCEKEPSKAKKATIEFSEYLRRNMNSLKEKAPVPFESELKHLETYLSLEKMRFGDELNIEYDIETTDFMIPSLTVQPLVENAVKHGVGMLEDGGTVTIATREYDNRFEVIVSDDGVGFDPAKVGNDGRTHVGMENVRNRLKSMCNAVLNIESKVGAGTKATITIPKEE